MAAFQRIAGPFVLCVLAACGGYSAPTGTPSNNPPPTPNPSSDIDIVVGASTKSPGTLAFSPNPKTVSAAAGGNVRWVNQDISGGDYTMGTAVVHHIVSDDNSFNPSPNLGGNDVYSVSITTVGDHPYSCSIHPTMKGTIHVDP